jgi:hypothetical protein
MLNPERPKAFSAFGNRETRQTLQGSCTMEGCKRIELNRRAIKVTWCACKRCQAFGPRTMSHMRHGREHIVTLRSDCCRIGFVEEPDSED